MAEALELWGIMRDSLAVAIQDELELIAFGGAIVVLAALF